jgi:hypothetical protein
MRFPIGNARSHFGIHLLVVVVQFDFHSFFVFISDGKDTKDF